jgi:myosin heavy subunit
MKALNDRKAQEEERKQLEIEARQQLEKRIAKEEFLKQQRDLELQREKERERAKDAHQRQLQEVERKRQAEMDKQEAKESAFRKQEAKKAEMRAQDLRRTDILEQQKAKFQEQVEVKQIARAQRVEMAVKINRGQEDKKRQELNEKMMLEQQRTEHLQQVKAVEAESMARKGMQQMMRRRVIADEAARKAEDRRLAILELQEENELRLLEHEQKKERYLDFKRELDGLKERNKEINVERQRRKEAAARENVANQVKKKDEKIEVINAERKRLFEIRKAQQTEAYRARELVRSEIMRQRIASKYNSKLLEDKMQQLDITPGMAASLSSSASMPDLKRAPRASELESPTADATLTAAAP